RLTNRVSSEIHGSKPTGVGVQSHRAHWSVTGSRARRWIRHWASRTHISHRNWPCRQEKFTVPFWPKTPSRRRFRITEASIRINHGYYAYAKGGRTCQPLYRETGQRHWPASGRAHDRLLGSFVQAGLCRRRKRKRPHIRAARGKGICGSQEPAVSGWHRSRLWARRPERGIPVFQSQRESQLRLRRILHGLIA